MGNTNKLMEASMALIQGAPERQLNIVALNKALFYLDLFALRDFGRMVTNQTYVALPQGPVVENYQSTIVRALEEEGLAEQLEIGKAKPVRVVKPIEHFKLLQKAERELARVIGAMFSQKTSTLLSNVSHDNPGWILARSKGVKGAAEINMLVAMQQIVDDENEEAEWVSAPLSADMQAEFDRAHLADKIWE